ncbi:MSCRAMM family protein [Amycolatopsis taiwanensis]|uniref:Uncharacterized protein n=1 Tax=Amycolatopsis taiwanensis TaxID=342230 RepID=A0A9W6R0Z9_9PSEU|nr:carboxypeptidase regulatory-like domain-containing protein [Amycolatopsis taiwanensis]GLY65657.1 hypothetical protein Atai01_22760 [Amycolatopsis taiwanensis]
MIEVSGRVTDPGDTPVPQAAVTLVDASGLQIARNAADHTGAFTLWAPGAGSYVLIASAPAHRPEAATVNVAAETVRLDLVLHGASGLSGVVRAERTGVPIMDAVVTLTDLRGDVFDSRISGSGGEYAFPSLAPGTYTLAVNARSYRPTALAVKVSDFVATKQDVELVDGATIAGSVGLPDPRPEVTVTLLDEAGHVVRSGTVDANGRYAFHDLDAGTYTVVATSYPPVRQPVQVGGERTRHDVRLS